MGPEEQFFLCCLVEVDAPEEDGTSLLDILSLDNRSFLLPQLLHAIDVVVLLLCELGLHLFTRVLILLLEIMFLFLEAFLKF